MEPSMSPVCRQPRELPTIVEDELSAPTQRQVTDLTALRAARVRHKAIARGLQTYFDSVTAEGIPPAFVEILEQQFQTG